jgi:AcrR family transcriptional regulator
MSATQRREQRIGVARPLFAEQGYESVSVEQIAGKAKVSKPLVYEHFGGKEGLYAVIVDREMNLLLNSIIDSLTGDHPRQLLEQAATALFDYIEGNSAGFGILVRDSPVSMSTGTFAGLISEVASRVEYIMAAEFKARGYSPKLAPMYSRMLVGMVALTGQWWLDARKPRKEVVVAHLVNLAWNGLSHLDPAPR